MGKSNLPEAIIATLGGIGFLLILVWFRSGADSELLKGPIWWYCFAAALSGAYIWFHGLKRGRLTSDIAKSRLNSSAQGYGWLVGKTAGPSTHNSLRAPNGYECVWYRYYNRPNASQGGGLPVMLFSLLPNRIGAAIETCAPTLEVRDGEELYYVFPDGAQVLSRNRMEWDGAMGDYALDYLAPGEQIYILGELSSHEHHFDRLREVNHLLSDMQADPIHWKRFDANGNDRLDGDELDNLHLEAIRLADIKEREHATIKPIHHIRKPSDGREFIISNIPPNKLQRYYTRLMLVGLLFFFGAGSICVLYLPLITPLFSKGQ